MRAEGALPVLAAAGFEVPQRRRLDSTGVAVPPRGLGRAAPGRLECIDLAHGDHPGSGRSVEGPHRKAWSVQDATWAAGIRCDGAARSYGRGERLPGGWLAAADIDGRGATVGLKRGCTCTAGRRVDASVYAGA